MKIIDNPTLEQVKLSREPVDGIGEYKSEHGITRVEILVEGYNGDCSEECNGYWCEVDYVDGETIAFERPGSSRYVLFCKIENIKAVRKCSDEYLEGFDRGYITGWNAAPRKPRERLT